MCYTSSSYAMITDVWFWIRFEISLFLKPCKLLVQEWYISCTNFVIFWDNIASCKRARLNNDKNIPISARPIIKEKPSCTSNIGLSETFVTNYWWNYWKKTVYSFNTLWSLLWLISLSWHFGVGTKNEVFWSSLVWNSSSHNMNRQIWAWPMKLSWLTFSSLQSQLFGHNYSLDKYMSLWEGGLAIEYKFIVNMHSNILHCGVRFVIDLDGSFFLHDEN